MLEKVNRARQTEARQRRDQQSEAEYKKGILTLKKHDLIKLVRRQQLEKKQNELEQQKLARTWCIYAATRRIFVKLFRSLKQEIDDRRIQIASFIIAKRFIRFTKTSLIQQGPTQEFRYRNLIRHSANLEAIASQRVIDRRAKSLLSLFLTKCGQTMHFKITTYDFLSNAYRINGQMQSRLKQHRLKMISLDLMFERELNRMQLHAFSNFKKKKYQALIVKLNLVQSNHKNALLKEYFSMCKMVYRIRCVVAYMWDQGEHSSNMIKELYNSDPTFTKMIQILKQQMYNLFHGTDPDQQLANSSGEDSKTQQTLDKVTSAMRRMSLMPFNIKEQSAKLHEEILSQFQKPNAVEPA